MLRPLNEKLGNPLEKHRSAPFSPQTKQLKGEGSLCGVIDEDQIHWILGREKQRKLDLNNVIRQKNRIVVKLIVT
jgi:hypothetical protein